MEKGGGGCDEGNSQHRHLHLKQKSANAMVGKREADRERCKLPGKTNQLLANLQKQAAERWIYREMME